MHPCFPNLELILSEVEGSSSNGALLCFDFAQHEPALRLTSFHEIQF